jgi:putative transposase
MLVDAAWAAALAPGPLGDLDLWVYCEGCHVGLLKAGKPANSAFIEAFNGRFRAAGLNTTLADAREK